MTYPVANISGLTGLWAYDNAVTGGWFSILFLGSIFFIIFIYFKTNRTTNYRTSDCLYASFFITFVLGSLIWAVGLVDGTKVVILLVLTLLSALYAYLEG